jgi:hypothetical protein
MSNEQKSQQQDQQPQDQQPQGQQGASQQQATPDVDGLADKKPEELTPDELRLMADTMPGEGPGD